MKRYVCTVATGLLLALMGTGTATAGILPLPALPSTQDTSFGDQTVGEQKNTADVTQAQGNGNLNIAPAVAIFGDAETSNAQGNGNTAIAVVDQSNSVDQSQSSTQKQSPSGCCRGSSQAAEQTVDGGDQSVEKQKNEADVGQYQGNGNLNIAPAVAIFGDAETSNAQGNGNTAIAVVDQSNSVDQSQSSTQKQYGTQDGNGCCGGRSQAAEQTTSFGDQHVGEQRNEADVEQYQGNGNVNVSPAIALFGDAETWNAQGNGNKAVAVVDQSNAVTQSQRSTQKQEPGRETGGCCELHHSPKKGYGKPDGRNCCEGQSRPATQTTSFGDQSVEQQSNDAVVTQKQGNGNVNVSPAISLLGGKKGHPCAAQCGTSPWTYGGGALTTNEQGNWNRAAAIVGQSNLVDQSQSSSQRQSLADLCKGLIYRP